VSSKEMNGFSSCASSSAQASGSSAGNARTDHGRALSLMKDSMGTRTATAWP